MSIQTKSKKQNRLGYCPRYKVLLHNDDHNPMDHVVISLMEVVGLALHEAERVMWEAHNTGIALVTVVPEEHAEHFVEGLTGRGLKATLEPE